MFNPIAVLGSTKGTVLAGLLQDATGKALRERIALVLSDQPRAMILTRAAQYGIPTKFINSQGVAVKTYDDALLQALKVAKVKVLLLIGYQRLLSSYFLNHFTYPILNVHPSLLPAFSGLMDYAVHEAVLAAGVTESGCTIHRVTPELDAGPIVLQKRCAVYPEDTVVTLRARIQQLEVAALAALMLSQGKKF